MIMTLECGHFLLFIVFCVFYCLRYTFVANKIPIVPLTTRPMPASILVTRTGLYIDTLNTRKLCYRKDDRAMRPIYGCPENFRDCLTTPTATIPNIFMGFCSDRLYECSYKICKSVALPVPEIIGGTQKIGQSLDTPTLPFLKNF